MLCVYVCVCVCVCACVCVCVCSVWCPYEEPAHYNLSLSLQQAVHGRDDLFRARGMLPAYLRDGLPQVLL